MPLTHDPAANVAYLRLRTPRGDLETIELAPGVLLDVDATGRACGIELLDANAVLRRDLSPREPPRVSRAPSRTPEHP